MDVGEGISRMSLRHPLILVSTHISSWFIVSLLYSSFYIHFHYFGTLKQMVTDQPTGGVYNQPTKGPTDQPSDRWTHPHIEMGAPF